MSATVSRFEEEKEEMIMAAFGLYGILLTIIVGVFIYTHHRLSFKAMENNNDAWKHAVHSQDDAWQRQNQERAHFGRMNESLTQWNATLTKQAAESGNREVNEARRFMEAIKQDLVNRVTRAVTDSMVSQGQEQYRKASSLRDCLEEPAEKAVQEKTDGSDGEKSA